MELLALNYILVKKLFKILINDDKIRKDQLHFVERPESENGLFTAQILRKYQRDIHLETVSRFLQFKNSRI